MIGGQDAPALPSDLEVVAGRSVLRLGDPAGARIIGEESAGDLRPLTEAIARSRPAQPTPITAAISHVTSTTIGFPRRNATAKAVAKAERVEEHATHVTDKLEAVIAKLTQTGQLISEVATGHIDVERLAGPANELLGLLRKLDREGRCEEALRVARCLAVLLALLKRWAELLDSLQTALNIATQLDDTSGRAWALHEQGTVRLAGKDYACADSQLSEARKLREKIGDARGARLTGENMQVLCRVLRERLHEQLHERPSQKLIRFLNRPAPTLLFAALLLISGGAAGMSIRGSGSTSHLLASHTAEIVIELTPGSPRAGAPAAFTAWVVGGKGTRYEWRFGDGEGTRTAAPTHVYRNPGTYEATLAVSNARGAILGQGTRVVQVRPEASASKPPPRASFRFSPASPVVGQNVSFDATPSSDPNRSASITSYVWRFGDGSTQRGPTPNHRYDRPGTYTAELVVADTREASASTTHRLIVKAATSTSTVKGKSASKQRKSASKPLAPTGVSASPGNGSATVAWTAPANDGGDTITSYTVTPYVGNVAGTSTTTSGTTSTEVGGLSNGTTYTFTVAAINSVGEGQPSQHSNPVTPTSASPQPTVPAAPSNVSATAGNGRALVSWSAPASGGSTITSYTVTPYVGSEATTAIIVSSGTSATVEHLANGTTYTFTVSASNAVGNGNASERSPPVTPAGTPSAPSRVTASASEEAATVSWSASASEGSPITHYIITPYSGSSIGQSSEASGSAKTITIHGLGSGIYTFTVAAVNGIGVGTASEHSNAVTIEYG